MTIEAKDQKATQSCITDARVAALRSLIGVRRPVAGWNHIVTHEGIQRFARGIGDDNPLWWDEDYAARSPLAGTIAPPCYLYSHANDMLDDAPGSGPFANHLPDTVALWAGEQWRWIRPVRVGEAIACERSLAEISVETGGRFADVSLTQVELEGFRTQDGELVAEHRQTFKRFDKRIAQRRGSYERAAPTAYTAEDRERFDAHYRDERRRGAAPRYIEDVRVDEPIAPMLKGPLAIGNLIGFMLGWGNGLGATNRMLSKQLAAFPEARIVNPESGAFDAVTACHWDHALAKQAGMPGGYDFGCQRTSWISHYLTDWAGDHGFLSDLAVRLRKPNILNDVSWITGRVTAIDPDQAIATVSIAVLNQLDEETASATGKVRLPKRAARGLHSG